MNSVCACNTYTYATKIIIRCRRSGSWGKCFGVLYFLRRVIFHISPFSRSGGANETAIFDIDIQGIDNFHDSGVCRVREGDGIRNWESKKKEWCGGRVQKKKKKGGWTERQRRRWLCRNEKKPSSVHFYYNDILRSLICNGVTKYFDTFFSFLFPFVVLYFTVLYDHHSFYPFDGAVQQGNRKKMYAQN